MTLPASNYTQVPNLILDNLRLLKEGEVRCILCICRETIGFHHAKRKLSLTYLQEKTGLSRQGVLNGTGPLLEKGWIDREKVNYTYHYWLNVTEEVVNEVDQSTNLTSQLDGLEVVNEVDQASQRSRPDLVNEVDTYKERDSNKDDLKKDQLNKEDDFTQQPAVELDQDKKKDEKGAPSQKKTRKTKPKPPVLTESEIQAFIDLYNQEKPEKWKPTIAPKDVTPALTRNLSLLVQEYGEDSMDKLRKALMVARTHKFWSGCEMKLEWVYRKPHHNINNPNKIAIILDGVSETDLARLDSPIAAHIHSPQDEKRARILERTARVVHRNLTGVVA